MLSVFRGMGLLPSAPPTGEHFIKGNPALCPLRVNLPPLIYAAATAAAATLRHHGIGDVQTVELVLTWAIVACDELVDIVVV